MGCGACICKCILVCINLVFILVGLALLAAGVLLKVGQDLFKGYIDGIVGQIPSISSGVNLANAASAPSNTNDLIKEIMAYADTIAIVLIIFGIFMFVMGCLGCCGACCVVKIMLIIYTVVVLVILLVQIVVFAMLMTGQFDDDIRTQLQKTIDEKYGGIDDFTPESLLLNFVMAFFKCCGLDGYTDFNNAVKWQKTRSFTVSGFTVTRTLATPVACCKMSGTFPNVNPVDANCTMTPTDANSNWKTGCWNAVGGEITPYKTYVIIAAAGGMVFELLLAILAIVLVRMSQQDEKVGVI